MPEKIVIEVHGFNRKFEHELLECNQLEEKIIAAVKDASYADDVIISAGNLSAYTVANRSNPFLRLWVSREHVPQLEDLFERLSGLNTLIQCVALASQFDPTEERESEQGALLLGGEAYPPFPEPWWGTSSKCE